MPRTMLLGVAVAAVLGVAGGVSPHAVGILVNHRMMIERVAVDFAERGRSPAHPMRLDGRLLLHRPRDPIQIVAQRLVYVVAGKPGEVHLGAELELDFIELGIAADDVVRTAEKRLLDRRRSRRSRRRGCD